jgi:hypothetical protein
MWMAFMSMNSFSAQEGIKPMFRGLLKRSTFLPLIAFFFCSCVTYSPYVVPEAVGPPPGAHSYGKEGVLRVYSSTAVVNDGGIQYLPHTSYRVYSTDGSFVKHVRNRTTATDQRPEMVKLPVGNYSVTATSEGMGVVKIPVTISGSQLTAVYLDGSQVKETEGAEEKQLVRFPNGKVVGWRAQDPESK